MAFGFSFQNLIVQVISSVSEVIGSIFDFSSPDESGLLVLFMEDF